MFIAADLVAEPPSWLVSEKACGRDDGGAGKFSSLPFSVELRDASLLI